LREFTTNLVFHTGNTLADFKVITFEVQIFLKRNHAFEQWDVCTNSKVVSCIYRSPSYTRAKEKFNYFLKNPYRPTALLKAEVRRIIKQLKKEGFKEIL
jgi:hypothetical protein